MKSVNKLIVTYHSRSVGTFSMTPDNRLCAFQYDREWLANGFSISPLDILIVKSIFYYCSVICGEKFIDNFQ